jgi:hypothetical protein
VCTQATDDAQCDPSVDSSVWTLRQCGQQCGQQCVDTAGSMGGRGNRYRAVWEEDGEPWCVSRVEWRGQEGVPWSGAAHLVSSSDAHHVETSVHTAASVQPHLQWPHSATPSVGSGHCVSHAVGTEWCGREGTGMVWEGGQCDGVGGRAL